MGSAELLSASIGSHSDWELVKWERAYVPFWAIGNTVITCLVECKLTGTPPKYMNWNHLHVYTSISMYKDNLCVCNGVLLGLEVRLAVSTAIAGLYSGQAPFTSLLSTVLLLSCPSPGLHPDVSSTICLVGFLCWNWCFSCRKRTDSGLFFLRRSYPSLLGGSPSSALSALPEPGGRRGGGGGGAPREDLY